MPKQNRVTPFSTLIATPARGALMGTRGCLHDAQGQIQRQFQGKRWIFCLLEFKGRRRPIMTPGRYTELCFLDEATALAAGHRPCAECQWDRYNRFRRCWALANPDLSADSRPSASVLDAHLHQQRSPPGGRAYQAQNSINNLPDGTFVTQDHQTAYLVLRGRALRWTPSGYRPTRDRELSGPIQVLTIPSLVNTLAAGYPVGIHESAD